MEEIFTLKNSIIKFKTVDAGRVFNESFFNKLNTAFNFLKLHNWNNSNKLNKS